MNDSRFYIYAHYPENGTEAYYIGRGTKNRAYRESARSPFRANTFIFTKDN